MYIYLVFEKLNVEDIINQFQVGNMNCGGSMIFTERVQKINMQCLRIELEPQD